MNIESRGVKKRGHTIRRDPKRPDAKDVDGRLTLVMRKARGDGGQIVVEDEIAEWDGQTWKRHTLLAGNPSAPRLS